MQSSNLVSFKPNEFVSISVDAKRINTRQHEILDSIAHELRTPITVMKSNIQLLKKCCFGSENSLIEESFLLCEDSVDNLLRFIDCVNFLSDTDQGKLKLKKVSFSLGLFIDQVMEELRQSNFDTSRIQINTPISGFNIRTDKYLLNRILINLLVNALKFSASTVELFIPEIKNQLTLVVRDSGIGIPDEELGAVFHPLVRASNVKMVSGTGLGLSILAKAVECLEGSVFVNSRIGKGSEFVVVIPFESTMKISSQVIRPDELIPQFLNAGMTIKDIHLSRAINFNSSGEKGMEASVFPCYDQIISTISHELRTPVAIINSNIQLLRKFSYKIDPLVLEESFSLCVESIDNVARFIDKIQLLNNANKSRIQPADSFFKVKKIIHHLYPQLAKMNFDCHHIELQWHLKDHEIRSDLKYLNQILFQTLGNALKFSNRKVQLIISTSHGQLSIMVKDEGIGIAKEEIEMIFQPFYRASNVKYISGTGLGLAIVHSLVEKLGGGIHVSSALGKGTTIQINLPYELPDQDSCN